MKDFVFKFEPVLGLKKQYEDSCKNELGKAVKKYEAEKNVLKLIEEERDVCLDEMKKFSNNNIDILKMREYNNFIGVLKKNINSQENNIKSADENVSTRRIELNNAVIQRKVFDKLRQKQQEEYSKVRKIKEQNSSDEIAGSRYYKAEISPGSIGGKHR